MIGILTWEIRYGNTVLPALSGNITIDDQNIPAIVAEAVVPYDEAVFDAIDPRQSPVPRVTITGRFVRWASESVADVTAWMNGQGINTVAELSAAWAGKSVSDISDQFGTPLDAEAAGDTEPDVMSLDLHVREISHDYLTMTVSLASDEALLTDWSVASIWELAALSELLTSYNNNIVSAYVNIGLVTVLGEPLLPSVYNTQLVSGDFDFDIMQALSDSAWEIMRPVLEDGDLKLRVQPTGKGFRLERPENPINNPATHSWLFTRKDVLSARPVRSRLGDWYDSAMFTEDGVGGGFGYPSTGNYTRTYTENRPAGSGVTNSWAENLVKRARNRGELIEIVAPIQLGVFMTDEFTYAPFDGATGAAYQWRVKSVNYDFDAGTMTFRGERRY